MFDFYGDFFQSPAGRGDVSATSPLVAETNFTRYWGDVPRRLRDVSETCWRLRRRLRDVSETCWRLRRRCSDFSATLLDAVWPTLVITWLSVCWHHRMIDLVVDLGIFREQSRRRLRFGESASYFWSPESPESPRLISRGSRGDVSASEIGP